MWNKRNVQQEKVKQKKEDTSETWNQINVKEKCEISESTRNKWNVKQEKQAENPCQVLLVLPRAHDSSEMHLGEGSISVDKRILLL
jgi:hypothetical protein